MSSGNPEYEVLVQRDGRWQVDCRLRHRDQALEEARNLARRSDVDAVKVVEELADPETGEPVEKVIHDSGRTKTRRPAPGGRRQEQATPAPTAAASPTAPARQDWTAPLLGGIAVTALLAVTLVVLG